MFKHILFISAFYSIAVSATNLNLSSRDIGNGGDVIDCQDVMIAPRLLDYYEMEQMRGIPIDISINATLDETMQILLQRIAIVNPILSETFRINYENFNKEAAFVPNATLVDIPDSKHVAIPKGCDVKQIVIQQAPKMPKDKRYIVSKDLWDRMSARDRAGLIMHELIYREVLDRAENSIAVRYLNAIYATGSYPREIEEMIEIGKALPFESLEYRNMRFLNDHQKGYQLAGGKLYEIRAYQYVVKSPKGLIEINFDYFDKTGRRLEVKPGIWGINLQSDHDFGRLLGAVSGFDVRYLWVDESGGIQVIKADSSRSPQLQTPSYRLTLNSSNEYLTYPNGLLLEASCGGGNDFVTIGDQTFTQTYDNGLDSCKFTPTSEIDRVMMHRRDALKWTDSNRTYVLEGSHVVLGVFPNTKTIRYFGTRHKYKMKFSWAGGRIAVADGEVYENGDIKRANHPYKLFLNRKIISIDKPVFARDGKLRAAIALEDLSMQDANNQPFVVKKNQTFWLDANGKVIGTGKEKSIDIPGRGSVRRYFIDIPDDPVAEY